VNLIEELGELEELKENLSKRFQGEAMSGKTNMCVDQDHPGIGNI
jgi:hypothetical protein